MSTHRLAGAWCPELKVSLVGLAAPEAGGRRPRASGGQAATLPLEGAVESSVFGVAERVRVAWPPAPLLAAENLLIEAPAAIGAKSVRVAVDGDRVVRIANLDPDAPLDGFAMHLAERQDGSPRLLTIEAYAERDAVGAPIARRALRIEGVQSRMLEDGGALLSPRVEPAAAAPRAQTLRPAESSAALRAAIEAARRVAGEAGGRLTRAEVANRAAAMPRIAQARRDARPDALSLSFALIDPETDLPCGVFAAGETPPAAFAGRVLDLKAVLSGPGAALLRSIRFKAVGSERDETVAAMASEGARVGHSFGWTIGGAEPHLAIEAIDGEGRVIEQWDVRLGAGAPATPAQERPARSAPKRVFHGAGLARRLGTAPRGEKL